MAKFIQTHETDRFIKAFNKLNESGIVKNKSEFAIKLEYTPQGLNSIFNGSRNVTVELLNNLFKVFKVDPNFVFSDQEELIKTDIQEDKQEELTEAQKELNRTINLYEDQIELLRDIISMQKDTIKDLRGMLKQNKEIEKLEKGNKAKS